jgi:uncharacterized delta-60 repeat protein
VKVSALLLFIIAAALPAQVFAAEPCDQCSASVLLTNNAGYSQIAADESHIFFGDNRGNVKKISKIGGTAETLATYPGNGVVVALALDAENVYFGTGGPPPLGYGANTGAIATVPKNGGAMRVLSSTATNIVFMQVHGDFIYYKRAGRFFSAGSKMEFNGVIARIPKTGGNEQVLASGLGGVYGFTIDGNWIVFGEPGYGDPTAQFPAPAPGLKRVPITGGSVEMISAGVAAYVTSDEKFYYASTVFSGTVFKVAKTGGSRITLGSGLVWPTAVQHSNGQLFFTVDGNAGREGFVGVIDTSTDQGTILREPPQPNAVPLTLDDCAVYFMTKDESSLGSLHKVCRPRTVIAPKITLQFQSASAAFGEHQSFNEITLVRTGSTNAEVRVNLQIAGGTAIPGSDFTVSSNAVFSAGSTNTKIFFQIRSNLLADGDRSVTLNLANPSFGASLGTTHQMEIRIVDNDFAGPGKPNTNLFRAFVAGYPNQIIRGGSNSIYLSGPLSSVNGSNVHFLARLENNGSLNSTFAPALSMVTAPGSIAISSEGGIYVGGQLLASGGTNLAGVALLKSNGSLDGNFIAQKNGLLPNYTALLLQPDGKLLAGGLSSGATNLVRFLPTGSLDNTFSVGSGVNGPIRALALQSDGKVLVGGRFSTFNGINRSNLARVDANGVLDPSFQTVIKGPPLGMDISEIHVLATGKIVIAGSFTNINGVAIKHLARLDTSGQLDATFIPPLFDGSVRAVLTLPGGRLLVGGSFTQPANYLVMLRDDGSLETSFDTGAGPGGGSVTALALWSSDKVLVGGEFKTYNELPLGGLVLVDLPQFHAAATAFTSVAAKGNVLLLKGSGPGSIWLETSTDLKSWNLVTQTNTGNFEIEFPISLQEQGRYFRVR